MVDLAQTIEEWRDLCSIKVDDQVDDNAYTLLKVFIIIRNKKMITEQS